MTMQRIGGWAGSERLDTGTHTELKRTSLRVRSDTTFVEISGTGPGGIEVDFIELFGLDASPAPTNTANDFYCVEQGYEINTIQLTGSIIVY